MIDEKKLIKDIRAYADLKHYNGEVEMANGILKSLSIIENQPQVNQWIPCSERLPEKNGTYIVTQAMHSLKNHNEILRIDTEYADFSNGAWRRAKHLEVIAWKPLPEPYKEVSE